MLLYKENIAVVAEFVAAILNLVAIKAFVRKPEFY